MQDYFPQSHSVRLAIVTLLLAVVVFLRHTYKHQNLAHSRKYDYLPGSC
ncbi:hypothetical protein SAMD00079811_22170 [Scytonema sp. HK-05]|nr:hypothetical protein SAMD00079811_22170 [Scytonema sp. HK-05]